MESLKDPRLIAPVLLESGRAEEAERTYREDLVQYPENGWGLFGLARALSAQDKVAEAQEVETRFAKAWASADIQLDSTCLCLGRRAVSAKSD